MKNLKTFGQLNENHSDSEWSRLGPNWLFDYIMTNNESGCKADYLTYPHRDLDVTIIFFLHNGDIRWNWTWGSDEADIKSVIASEIKSGETFDYKITGDSPGEFIKNVIAKISVVEKKRREDDK